MTAPSTQAMLATLVIGAGEAGRALARDLVRVESFGLRPVGFIDDQPVYSSIDGLPVLGALADLENVLEALEINVVVIAIPSMPHAAIVQLANRCAAYGVTVRHLPPFLAALQREIAGTDMRTLPLGSLLGRPEMHVASREAAALITGRRVLVTGAGGSIGSELCRQLNAFEPASLILLDHDESNLHRLQLEIWGEADLGSDQVVMADIRDEHRIHRIFADYRPEIVFHAAALKHLTALERHPCEGVKSNVVGTENLVRAAVDHGVERFVLISTDKAANPTSVLGATKQLAELVLQAYEHSSTRLCAVRFGNVLGSRGSLLHVLRQQMSVGDQVTVTHPDVTRFFMSIEEAVGLVLEAARMADSCATYVLDMGQPVRIVELVDNFARLLNLRDVNVRYTGLRPGEKLAEELYNAGEVRIPTDHPRISMVKPVPPKAGFHTALRDLYYAAADNRADEVIGHLQGLVGGYERQTLTKEVVA